MQVQELSQNPKSSRRLELDALRGLAAVAVVISHFLNIYPQVFDSGPRPSWAVWLIRDTPLHMPWAGFEAVVFFFVLSGFVLSLPFYTKPPKYKTFIIRRICRIYIPYIAAVTVAILSFALFNKPGRYDGLSSFFTQTWIRPITWQAIANHAMLVGSFACGAFNPVFWSLVHEMRISIIFPFLMWVILRKGFKFAFAASLALYLVGRALMYVTIDRMGWENDYFLTLTFVYMFVVGAYLAKNMEYFAQWYRRMNKPTKYALLVLAIFAYTNVYWMESFFGVHLPGARTFIATAGVAIFVIIGSASARSVAWLTRKEFVFIGRVSYSLYLLHLVILVSLVHMLYGVIPLAWILVIAAASIFLVTALSYWGIEEPAMALGRRLTAKRGGGPPLSTPPASSQREVSQSGQAKP